MSTAMKIALDAAARAGAERGLREFRAIESARAAVRPFVGEVPACDTAAGVYKQALEKLGQDTFSLPPAALPTVFRAWTRRGARPHVAMDAKAVEARSAMFPNADRLGVAGR